MTWVKLGDEWYSDPVVARLPLALRGLLVTLLCFASHHRRMNLITDDDVHGLPGIDHAEALQGMEELKSRGVLVAVEGGFEVVGHQYFQYTREETVARRQAQAEGRTRGGQARAATAARENGRFASSNQDEAGASWGGLDITSIAKVDAGPGPVPVHFPVHEPAPALRPTAAQAGEPWVDLRADSPAPTWPHPLDDETHSAIRSAWHDRGFNMQPLDEQAALLADLASRYGVGAVAEAICVVSLPVGRPGSRVVRFVSEVAALLDGPRRVEVASAGAG